MLTLPLKLTPTDLAVMKAYLRFRSIRQTAAFLHINCYKVRSAIDRFSAELQAAARAEPPK